MRIDSYTKFLLTVIALCLVWLSLGGPALLPIAKAQNLPGNQSETRVLMTGWMDKEGAMHGFAIPTGLPGQVTSGLPVVVVNH